MIDIHGQKVSAVDRLYLLGPVETLIVWGESDRTIPIQHGTNAHALIPHSRIETLPRAAHFPNLEDPAGLADVLEPLARRDEAVPAHRGGVVRADRLAARPRPAPARGVAPRPGCIA